MHRVVWVTAVCAAACAEIPDRGPANATDVKVDGTTMEVKGQNFLLQFATTGVRLPIAFDHEGISLLASDQCPEPSLAGVSLAPMTTAVGGRQVVPALEAGNTIAVRWPGPLVAQIVVGYQMEYTCNGTQILDGTSTFTVFPSGRVVRNDAVKPTQGPTISTVTCGGCSGPTSTARFESFWALAPGGERVQIDDAGSEQMLMPGAVSRTATACALYSTHGVAMTWKGDGVPSTEARAQDVPLEFRYDFIPPTDTLASAQQTGRSTFAFGPSGLTCTELAAEVDEPTLEIGGRPIDASAFGIYEYSERISSAIEVRTQRLEGYDHGVALRLEVGTPDHLRVEHASGGAVEYFLQPDGDTAYIIWIPNGVPHDDPIVIEPS